MNATPHLLLAEAAWACRTGQPQPIRLTGQLTMAQAGAALRLSEAGGIELAEDVLPQVAAVQAQVRQVFAPDSLAQRQSNQAILQLDELEQTLGQWLAGRTDADRVNTGYWLMGVFLRALNEAEAGLMTRFLASGVTTALNRRVRQSMRRYPTGGVSEKQSLILPAFLRNVTDPRGWCSPFLVGRRLAHTGGTHDKLASIPGMQLVPMSELQGWDGSVGPVRYYSANRDFCPRDAELYRMRGETGTVRDQGLMASSIMSKQISLPADVIILDILHGATAFLATRTEAEQFARLCQSIGREYGVSILPYLRNSDGALGRCIGNILEVWEATQMLHDAAHPAAHPALHSAATGKAALGNELDAALDAELELAIHFMGMFGTALGQPAAEVAALRAECLSDLRSGKVFEALLRLWAEHGVASDFLQQMRLGPRMALLGNLQSIPLQAPVAGTVVGWQAVRLADLVNNRLNAYVTSGSGEILGALVGGIEIVVRQGQRVEPGEPLAMIYGEQMPPPDLLAAVLALFEIR